MPTLPLLSTVAAVLPFVEIFTSFVPKKIPLSVSELEDIAGDAAVPVVVCV